MTNSRSTDQAKWRRPPTHLGHVLLGRERPKARLVAAAAVVWLGAAIAFMWEFSFWPSSLTAWVICLVVGPVGFLLLAAVGELVAAGFHWIPVVREARSRVLATTSVLKFSWLRIAYLLCEALGFIAVICGLAAVFAWATGA